MKINHRLIQIITVGFAMLNVAAAFAAPGGRSLVRDLEEYATASCLIEQEDAYLKDQGYRWSAIIVQGRGVHLAVLAPIDAAVKDRIAQGGMVIVHDETSPTGDKALPLVFCAEIIDAAAVRAAINVAVVKVQRSKRRAQ